MLKKKCLENDYNNNVLLENNNKIKNTLFELIKN